MAVVNLIAALRTRNERLTTALRDLVSQIRESAPRDEEGHLLTKNDAYLEAAQLLEEIEAEQKR
jgi:hypothetical protein